jgi:hypothetical protein
VKLGVPFEYKVGVKVNEQVPLITPLVDVHPESPAEYNGPKTALAPMPFNCPVPELPVVSRTYVFPPVRVTLPSLHAFVIIVLAAGIACPVVG